jgi:hypothetical protein
LTIDTIVCVVDGVVVEGVDVVAAATATAAPPSPDHHIPNK